jgi:hypothetical protein
LTRTAELDRFIAEELFHDASPLVGRGQGHKPGRNARRKGTQR